MGDFDYQHPVTGDLFVNRTDDLRDLVDRITGGANVLVIAPRRMGKSSLIIQAFKAHTELHGIYVTCPHKGTGHDLAEAILNEITLPLPKRIKDWFVEKAQRLRPVVTLEPSGAWTFTFDRMEPSRKVLSQTVKLLDDLAARLKKPVVLAIDEVQRILERDPDAFHSLRDVVQFQDQVRYVLSGSKFHVLQELLDAESPFGHQLTPIYVGTIPIRHFKEFATSRFSSNGNHLSNTTLERVGEICKGNPKRTQELLFDLLRVKDPTPQDAEVTAIRQVESQRHLFEDLLDQVAPGSPIDVLVGLASADPEIPVYGQEFLARSMTKTPAHVRSALTSLRKRGLVDQDNHFVDPYLRIYLRTQDRRVSHAPFD
jgi:uncharacterized protein